MVLLTRPLSQVGNLQSLLENSDLDYVLFPAIEINQIHARPPKQNYDVVIFVSVNAVIYAKEYFNYVIKESTQTFPGGPIIAGGFFDIGLGVVGFPEIEAPRENYLALQDFW